MSSSRQKARGVALVLVLWVTALLAVVASSFVFSTRTNVLLTHNAVSSAKAQALADAGIERGLFELLKAVTERNRWQADGTYHTWQLDDASVVSIQLTNVSGLVSINTASEDLLLSLFAHAGVDKAQADSIIASMVDWKDEDSKRAPKGAEAADYQAARLEFVPTNQAFTTIDQLQRVMGMTAAVYNRIASTLTVHSDESGVNTSVAPKEVLLALPGSSERKVERFMAERSRAYENNRPIPAFESAAGVAGGAIGSAYRVRAIARMDSGAVFVREAVVNISAGSVGKPVFLSWTEGAMETAVSGNTQR